MTDYKVSKRMFGTNGVRGVIGEDMSPDLAYKIGKAFGSMRNGTIAVGRDSRTSGNTLIAAVKAALLTVGCDVIDCGILPTPALQFIVKDRYDGGIMITASHNPPQYNGIKIIEPDGTEMGDNQTVNLEDLVFADSVSIVNWKRAGTEYYAPHHFEQYINAIANSFPDNIGKGMTIVIDPGSGPACYSTPRILAKMGCRILTINGVLDGTFPGRLPEPSGAGLSALAELVKASGAVMGIAHDGDADRTVFVDEKGQFIEENREFALIARFMCETRTGVIVTPVSTSQIVEKVANTAGSSVIYTPVGSIHVARTMRALIQSGENVIFGGEGNGGLIFPEHQFCRDGGMTAATMVSILATKKIPLSHLIENLPARYMVKEKISSKDSNQLLNLLRTKFSEDKHDYTDGLKIFRKDCWALIRASGTEPLVRIIIDGSSVEECNVFRDEIMNATLIGT